MIKKLTDQHRRLAILLTITILWLPYIAISFPGNIAGDSGTGILFFTGIDTSNPNNPYFQNILMGTCYVIGRALGSAAAGIGLYCVTQLVLEILLLTDIMYFLTERLRRKYLMIPLLALYCIIPTFPLYAFTMAKDSTFGLAVLLNIFCCLKMIHAGDAQCLRKTDIFLLSLSVVLIGLFRNYAWFLPLTVYIVFCFSKIKKSTLACTAMAAVFGALICPRLLGLPHTNPRESMSLPLQTTAFIYNTHTDEFSDEDIARIEAVIPIELFAEYNADNADMLKKHAEFTSDTKRDFMALWFRLLLRYPKAMLQGIYNSTYIYYTPSAFCDIKPHVYQGFQVSVNAREKLQLYNVNPYRKLISRIDAFVLRIPVVSLFAKTGIYTWLVILTAILIIVFQRWEYLSCFLLLLMILAGCLLGPINGYYRYAYSMILSAPIVFFDLLISIVKRSKHTETGGKEYGRT